MEKFTLKDVYSRKMLKSFDSIHWFVGRQKRGLLVFSKLGRKHIMRKNNKTSCRNSSGIVLMGVSSNVSLIAHIIKNDRFSVVYRRSFIRVAGAVQFGIAVPSLPPTARDVLARVV